MRVDNSSQPASAHRSRKRHALFHSREPSNESLRHVSAPSTHRKRRLSIEKTFPCAPIRVERSPRVEVSRCGGWSRQSVAKRRSVVFLEPLLAWSCSAASAAKARLVASLVASPLGSLA
jgi:hypothetical protein